MSMDERVKSAGIERSKRRRERLAIGIAAFLIAALTILEANIATVGGSVAFTSNIVIFALINLNVILIVLLIFLVTRNIFKLILDRKRKILGAKIRSRLVLMFISFSIVPTILLFVAATNITTTSIKSWIGGRVGTALTGSLEIVRKSLEEDAGRLKGLAERAARTVESAAPGGEKAALQTAREGLGREVSLFMARDSGIVAESGEISPQISSEILSRLKGLRFGAKEDMSETLVGETFAAAAWRLSGGRVAVAVRTLPPEEAHRIHEITRAYDEYHQVRLMDDPIRASYVAILILITLLIVFAASWMGIYLAKQITVPVQLLAEGTEKVAAGDLDVRLDYDSNDEFGTLVASFNRMTADLKRMKGNIEETNLSLTTTFDELRRRTQFIEAILTNISTGVIVIDRHGRIAMINKVAERLLGIKTEKVLGQLYREVVREEHYEAVRSLTRGMEDAAGGQVERQVTLSVGGKEISLRVSLTSLQSDSGDYLGMVVAFDDLSQAMRLQKVLAWREVARRIAHEIRNPLTPIQLSTERLQKKFGSGHSADPVFDECAQTILSEVATLKHLVEEFTRFARMPAPVFKEGDIVEELRPIVETHRSAHPGISWRYEGSAVPLSSFDPFQIRRAVTNLLDNAAAALKGRGNVEVRVGLDPSSAMVRISVADDGPGIPAADRDRLFEPYFSRKEGGTGLGLAIVSAIANDHGGSVRVRDNEPHGSVFDLEFPAHRKGRV